MRYKIRQTAGSRGLTLLEMTISMAILAVLFAVLIPQLRLISNSWDSKAGQSDALQNGGVLLDHLQRNLSTARRITAVPDTGEIFGFIELEDNDANTFRYDAHEGTPKYVKFGVPGNLYDLAGPVSQFRVYSYSLLDVDNPMDPITDPNLIRYVEVEVTLTNSAAMGGDVTLRTAAFLRNDSVIEASADDPNLLFVSGGTMAMGGGGEIIYILTAEEQPKVTLIESWGYTVNVINHSEAQAQFDAAMAQNDVVYVSDEVSAPTIHKKLLGAQIGVVNESPGMLENLGFASSWFAVSNEDTLEILDSSHDITWGMANPTTVLGSPAAVVAMQGTVASGLENLAGWDAPASRGDPSLAVLETGAEIYGGGPAAGRRVHLPWGNAGFDVTSLNADGQTIMQRAIEWAAGGSGGGPGPGFGTYADSFNSQAFNGSSGNLDWSTSPWVEVGEADGVSSGDIGVFNDAAYWRLRLRDNDNGGEGVEREADLSAAGSATLEFYYRRYRLDDANDYAKIEISANGAAGPWTELLRLQGPANDTEYLLESQDISAYISANTRIRFITSPDMGGQDSVWFDDVIITISP